jgi:hypothetical protein
MDFSVLSPGKNEYYTAFYFYLLPVLTLKIMIIYGHLELFHDHHKHKVFLAPLGNIIVLS